MDVLNMTGRTLRFHRDDATLLCALEPDGKVWVRTKYVEVGEAIIDPVMGITVPVVESLAESVVGLPPERDDRLVIVSGLVTALSSRSDLVAPSQMLRLSGEALGPRSLMRLHTPHS